MYLDVYIVHTQIYFLKNNQVSVIRELTAVLDTAFLNYIVFVCMGILVWVRSELILFSDFTLQYMQTHIHK